MTDSRIVQPFLSGTPMSATFLVDGANEAHLLAVGYQRIVVHEGRFAYQGGKLPAPAHFCDTNVWAAVAAVPGLRGLVGIDFLGTEAGSIVLEINPRPTTSIVAILELFPPGTLAKAWMAAIMGTYQGPDFADLIDRSALRQFDPDGKVMHL